MVGGEYAECGLVWGCNARARKRVLLINNTEPETGAA
jgi:hypothetical protein